MYTYTLSIIPLDTLHLLLCTLDINAIIIISYFYFIVSTPLVSDEVSYKRNNSLKIEFIKANPNHLIKKKLLQLTHEHMQTEISTCQASLNKRVETYPFSKKLWVKNF